MSLGIPKQLPLSAGENRETPCEQAGPTGGSDRDIVTFTVSRPKGKG